MIFGSDQSGDYFCYSNEKNILKCFKIGNPSKIEIFHLGNYKKKKKNLVLINSWKKFETNFPSFAYETLIVFLLYEFCKIQILNIKQKNKIKINLSEKIISFSNFENTIYACSDFAIYVFDLFSGETLKIFSLKNLHNKTKCKKIKISNNGLYLFMVNDCFVILNLKTGKMVKKIRNLKLSFNIFGFLFEKKIILGSKKKILEIVEIEKKISTKLNFEFFLLKNFPVKNFIIQNYKYFTIFVFQNFKLFIISFKLSEKNLFEKSDFDFIKFNKNTKLVDILKKNHSFVLFCKKKKKIFPILLKKFSSKKKYRIKKLNQLNKMEIFQKKFHNKSTIYEKEEIFYFKFQEIFLSKKNKQKRENFSKINIYFKIKKKNERTGQEKFKNGFFLLKYFDFFKSSEKIVGQLNLFNEFDILKYLFLLNNFQIQTLFLFLLKKIFLNNRTSIFLIIWIKQMIFCKFLLFSQDKVLMKSFSVVSKQVCKIENEIIFFNFSIQLSLIIIHIVSFLNLEKGQVGFTC